MQFNSTRVFNLQSEFLQDGFVIVKEEIPILAEEEKVESIIKEENSDHQSKEKSAERESDDGEIDTKDGGDIEVIRADINGVKGEENVNTEEKNEIGEFCNGNGEINEEKCVEEPEASEIVFSEKTLLTTDDSVQIAVKSEEDKVEEKTAIIHLTMLSVVSEEVRENAQVINHVEEDKTSMEIDAKQNVEEDQISPEEVEVVKYVANENLELHENEAENKDDVKREGEEEEELIVHEMSNMVNGEVSRNEESTEVIETKSLVHTRAKTNRMKIMMDYGGDLNESEENSKWEGEWPKVSSKETKEGKGMSYDYEVGGKIQEDYSATKGTFTNKDEVMTSNPTRWRVMIWTLSVLSSLSCSWFFDLSSAKLCLVLFLTVFLLEIYGYPLLNRRQAQCLHAAKGERIYEQRSLKKKK